MLLDLVRTVGNQEDDRDVPFLAVLEELFHTMNRRYVHEEDHLAGANRLNAG
jgi:hypothetical protein